MDIRWTAILLGMIGAVRTEAAEKILVDVYVQKDSWHQPLEYAEVLVSQIFDRSDVRVIWHAGRLPKAPCTSQFCIGIDMPDRAPIALNPDALASARPYGSSGSLINIYVDRVQRALGQDLSLSPVFLAYIFAHELAHVMQGYDYHSDSGILKAQWSLEDHAAMRLHRLVFSDDDSNRIRLGLSARLAAR